MRRPDALASWLVVISSLAAAATAVVAMLWLGNVTAYTPQGATRCGRAFQELPHLLVRVSGRCHLARQARLWLGLQAAAAALLAGLTVAAEANPTSLDRIQSAWPTSSEGRSDDSFTRLSMIVLDERAELHHSSGEASFGTSPGWVQCHGPNMPSGMPFTENG